MHEARRESPRAHEGTGSALDLPDLELNLTTLAASDVPATLRSMLRLRLPLWQVTGSAADDIELVAVELSSNACAATPADEICFKALFDPQTTTVWVGVWDSSPILPIGKMPELSLESIDAMPSRYEFGGWGLPLTRALSLKSGTSVTPTGKWVYALLRGLS